MEVCDKHQPPLPPNVRGKSSRCQLKGSEFWVGLETCLGDLRKIKISSPPGITQRPSHSQLSPLSSVTYLWVLKSFGSVMCVCVEYLVRPALWCSWHENRMLRVYTPSFVIAVMSCLWSRWRHILHGVTTKYVTCGYGWYYLIQLRFTWHAYVLVIRGILAIKR